jgi:hypothetical protein
MDKGYAEYILMCFSAWYMCVCVCVHMCMCTPVVCMLKTLVSKQKKNGGVFSRMF